MVEGIFRVSGSAKRISMLQRIFNDSEDFGATFNWEGGYTVHDAANVMRRFLNHLPEPVITLDYYRPFKDTMCRFIRIGGRGGVRCLTGFSFR